MTGNDISEGRAFAASEASLESMTRDFVDVFDRKLVPSDADILAIKNKKLRSSLKSSVRKLPALPQFFHEPVGSCRQ